MKKSKLVKSSKSFEIVIGLEKVKVNYESWEITEHFEFFGKSVSETGYRSYFFYKEELKGKTIEEFALEVGKELNAGLQIKAHNKKYDNYDYKLKKRIEKSEQQTLING